MSRIHLGVQTWERPGERGGGHGPLATDWIHQSLAAPEGGTSGGRDRPAALQTRILDTPGARVTGRAHQPDTRVGRPGKVSAPVDVNATWRIAADLHPGLT